MQLANNFLEESSYNQSIEQGEFDRLIFPINVHESLQASSGLQKSEKFGIAISFWVFGCAVLAWFLAAWLRTVIPNYYVVAVIFIELLLQLTVGVYLLRFLLDERSIFAEMDDSDKSFANYFSIYKEVRAADNGKYPFDILEFDDGSYGVFVECRLGFNTQSRSENTYLANKTIVELLDKMHLSRKVYYMNESFASSSSAQELRDILSNIADPKLFTVYRDIVQNYLKIAENESNVLCVTYLIYASTRIEKDELVSSMNQVFLALEKDETAFIQVSALRYEEIVEFLRRYYRIEVLDMGVIRAHIAEKKASFNCPVKVLKIYGRSGKIYANEDFKNLGAEIRSQGGLDSVN